jgi:hypothetical protein
LSRASASIYPSNMGISKLTCTLKGGVPPKFPLDEDVHKDVGYFACSSNKLIEYFILFLHGGFLGRVRVIFLKKYKLKTQLAILGPRRGHALKNDQEQPTLIPLIRIIFGTK